MYLMVLLEAEIGVVILDIEAPTETLLFRIVQEAFTNVVKHADANRIWLAILTDGSQIDLLVEDNGSGIDEQYVKGKKGCLGLRRAAALGGTLEVSATEKGTSISLQFLHRQEEPAP